MSKQIKLILVFFIYTNRITATLRGDYAGVVEASAVDWQLAAKLAPVAGSLAHVRTLSLTGLVNQDLARLHEQKYQEPRPKTYSIMVQENGRSIWDWNAQGYCVVQPHTDRLQTTDGRFVSDAQVPFSLTVIWGGDQQSPGKRQSLSGTRGHRRSTGRCRETWESDNVTSISDRRTEGRSGMLMSA